METVTIRDSEGLLRRVNTCCEGLALMLKDRKVIILIDGREGEYLGYAFDDSWQASSWVDYCPSCGKELPCHGEWDKDIYDGEVVIGFD